MKPFAYLTRIGILVITAGLILMGCGGGGGAPAVQPSTAQGLLVDAPVEGVSYQSGAQTGVTGRDGKFIYEIGKTTLFFIGKIELGEVPGKSLVTPLDLVSDGFTATDGVINLARFLQSLDADVNDDRITIPEAVRWQAEEMADLKAGLDFKNSPTFALDAPHVLKQLTTGVPQYNVVVNLVDTNTAAAHLKSSLQKFGINVDIPGQEPAGNTSALTRFTSAEELETYLKDGLRSNVKNVGYWQTFVDTPAVITEVTSAQAGDPGERVSITNIQEWGVDEADMIKSDGRYLYIAFYPIIRILELFKEPPSSFLRADIPLNVGNNIHGLYLVNGRGDGKPDLLAAVGERLKDMLVAWPLWDNPWFWQNGKTEIALYDVSTPSAPTESARLSLDGRLIASRRIDDVLYVVTRYTPTLKDFSLHTTSDQEIQQNESILRQVKLSDLLPKLAVNDVPVGSLVRHNDTFLPPKEIEQPERADLISVTAINLNSPETPVTQTIVAAAETVYASPQNLYLATTRYNYREPGPMCAEIVPTSTEIPEIPPETTDIHQFALTPDGPRYRGSGSVTGNLGWETDKRPFRFSEQGGVLRVATSLGDTWNETSRTRLSLLRLPAGDGGDSLEGIGSIDHIGEPGERLYAVRYLGDRAYLVTFRVTDPLYVFDLSDPANPVSLGQLHIDGYSDYLHPIGDNLLLGIGKDAVPDDLSTDFGGRGAWYQGVKLSLFDVSDPSDPREVSAIVLGKRGTQSKVLMDHHALTFLPPVGMAPARLAIPVQLHDTVPDDPGFDSGNPWASYEWTHTGLYLFEIDTGDALGQKTGLRKTGRMVVNERSESQLYWEGWGFIDRSVSVGESIHYVHLGSVWSASWDDPESLSIEQDSIVSPPLQPACEDPAPLVGQPDPRAPSYIVGFHSTVDGEAETARLAAKYGFQPRSVFTSIGGFGAELSREVVAELRCEPAVAYIEYDGVVFAH
ncbi:MAG: beta-propeller domain-containing protein [Candidatus Tectomicrobia bacterium]|uniref:Beta-propeller domain-containing protein n=1 Tax=Tectimicrobiota bacterium TaxID=2528274 RepID=A0A933GM77_UNCTE|nr:beta-propeller domain-containing protein [Candidatus Tectomicrobia bacterium]